MTYTFKLARRLAVSRRMCFLPALILIAACTDTISPDPETTPVSVQINPSSVTLETNQLIQFRARGLNQAGDDIAAPVFWSTTGGTILPDGRFSAAAVGTYQVIGRSRTQGDSFVVASSTVKVVRRPAGVVAIEISPQVATLAAGESKTFAAVGRRRDDSSVLVGINWTATGGTVDAGGSYVAGDTAGTYRVIANNLAGTLADTAVVTIQAASAPVPPPAPPPPPTPVLASVVLLPTSVTLAPGGTHQFAAFGRTTAGDSISVTPNYQAAGGSINSSGLYTAGTVSGSFRVIASSGGLADTSTVTINAPLGEARGIPYGPFNLFKSWLVLNPVGSLSAAVNSNGPSAIVAQIDTARKYKLSLILQMTGGSHSSYLTDGKFDLAKWKAVQATFNTTAIKDAVARGVADGTIAVAELQDEPEHSSWGGVMTGALIDEMSRYTKSIFPTLKTSILTQIKWVKAQGQFQSLDVMAPQYSWRLGSVTAYRDSAVAVARRANVGLMFSMNILNGGEQLGPDCPLDRTGGKGTWYYGYGDPYTGNCAMSAAQLENWGKILGLTPEACALIMWRYDDAFMARPENQSAFASVRAALSGRNTQLCTRPS